MDCFEKLCSRSNAGGAVAGSQGGTGHGGVCVVLCVCARVYCASDSLKGTAPGGVLCV